ncbi:MAG: protein kinase [bacterium]
MIGQTVSHYKILEKLGEGGMGVVYKAQDLKLDRIVALKFLPQHLNTNESEQARFLQEAKAAAALNHPNICTIHAIEEVDGRQFIVMEFVEGKTLRDATHDLSTAQKIEIASQIAEGLDAAHKKGIIHRDIKSDNIMQRPDGRIQIMDFGLAKLQGVSTLTKTGSTIGTTAYMSPEQARGDDVDHRTDIWSFGVVLYEMLTGQLPFKSDYEQATIYAILNEEPVIPVHLDANLKQVLRKALAKNPNDRYQSAGELAEELRGRREGGGNKTRTKPLKLSWMITGVVALLAAAAFYFLMPSSNNVGEKDAVKTIAVLPFLDMSPKSDQEYFSDGLSEELLNVLAKNPGLRVTSRTSSFSFKGTNTDIKTIASKLNVKHILEGSVRKSGESLRITAQLIDVETDAHLWSEIYDGTLKNIFALQDSIAGSVAEALKVALLGKNSETKKRGTDPEAYNAYLLGKHFYAQRSKSNWEKAESYYEKALSIDPSYAPAWVGLSKVHSSQADLGFKPVDESFRKAREEAEKALTLDSNFADAYSQMGWIKRGYDWDWTGADKSYRRALELEPGDASIITNAAVLAATLGRLDEAIKLNRHAIELNPLSVARYNNLGFITLNAGLLDESEMAFRKTLELNPRYPGGHVQVGLVYLEKRKLDLALAEMKLEAEPDWQMYGLALVYHALGRNKGSDDALEAFKKDYQDNAAYQIAQIYAYRNEMDKAFEWLERAYSQHDGGCSEIKGDSLMRNIVKDPRYVAFMTKMKLPV